MSSDTETNLPQESHYRPSACRSTTPFFSARHQNHEDILSHEPNRTRFQHDRDKIVYSLGFRQLRLKSQMFPENTGEHVRTRLDHSIEVAQIGRHMARHLRLNEDLVDAIALAHDIGHAPFAHSGERALNKFLRTVRERRTGVDGLLVFPGVDHDGFKHNWQGLRVVDLLAESYPEHRGLNLTNAVRIGILKHTGLVYRLDENDTFQKNPCSCDMELDLDDDFRGHASQCIFEVQLVAFADEIAQAIHDFEDAVFSDTIDLESVLKESEKWPVIDLCLKRIEQKAQTCPNAPPELHDWIDLSQLNVHDDRLRLMLLARLRSEVIFQLTSDMLSWADTVIPNWENEHLGDTATIGNPDLIRKFNEFVTTVSEPLPEITRLDRYSQQFKDLRNQLLLRLYILNESAGWMARLIISFVGSWTCICQIQSKHHRGS